MSELEYFQLAGHITEKLDNTAEYEDWLTIQNYVEKIQSSLTKEQIAYISLRDTFNKQHQEKDNLIKYLEDKINNMEIEQETEYRHTKDVGMYFAYQDILERVKNNKYD